MVSIWQSAVRATRPPRRTLAGLNLALVAFSSDPCLPGLNLRQGRADMKHLSFGLHMPGRHLGFWLVQNTSRQNP